MKSRRTYTQRARATAAAATRQRILDETAKLAGTHFRVDIHLDEVAANAQVSVQTILRLFETRAALIEEAFQQVGQHISEQRNRATPGDIAGAIAGLFDHYEEVGDIVIRTLAQEDDPAVQPGVAIGRQRHREWVERHFAPQLAQYGSAERKMRVDALVCVCDVYIWKLLRRDLRRSRAQAERTMMWMAQATLGIVGTEGT